jgi:hypothetical protein
MSAIQRALDKMSCVETTNHSLQVHKSRLNASRDDMKGELDSYKANNEQLTQEHDDQISARDRLR